MFNAENQKFIQKLGDKNLQTLRDQALIKTLKMRKALDLP